jgi:hypothetical protein
MKQSQVTGSMHIPASGHQKSVSTSTEELALDEGLVYYKSPEILRNIVSQRWLQ